MSAPCIINYEEISTRLLALSPTLTTVTLHPSASVRHTTIHKQLLELNEIHNALILLTIGELPYWRLNVKMPLPTILPSIHTFTEFVSERNRLFAAISEFDNLYRHLVHARKSHEENWAVKFNITLH